MRDNFPKLSHLQFLILYLVQENLNIKRTELHKTVLLQYKVSAATLNNTIEKLKKPKQGHDALIFGNREEGFVVTDEGKEVASQHVEFYSFLHKKLNLKDKK